MSLRIDTAEWISGALIIGDVGLGALGSEIPSSGESGAGYAYNDLSLPADANKEICGRITTWPSAGTLFAYEDTSFEFSGAPNGIYTFQYQLYVDGVAVGSPTTVTLTVGATSHVASGTFAAGAAVLSGAAAKSGIVVHAASGAFAAGSATISGISAHIAIHDASGSLVSGVATISGSAAIRVTHDADGSLLAGQASLSSVASIALIHDASGTLTAGYSSISAVASRGVLDAVRNAIKVWASHREVVNVFASSAGIDEITVSQRGASSSVTVIRKLKRYAIK
jgi:hypothetical protein